MPPSAGGSYVIVQKYLHDLDAWNALPTEEQESIIGRNKLSDIELDDSVKPTSAHNALTTDRRERQGSQNPARQHALRACRATANSAPISSATAALRARSSRCSRNVRRAAPGNYDRLLDFSRAVTGNLFFVPVRDILDDVTRADAAPGAFRRPPSPNPCLSRSRNNDGSLGIGSLKGEHSA